MKGYILMHRKSRKHWLHPSQENRKFSKWEAWEDILFMAAFEDKTELFNGDLLQISVGEFITSRLKLAQSWKWDRETVSKFLNRLIAEKMIAERKIYPKNPKSPTMILVNNYKDLQLKSEDKPTTLSTMEPAMEPAQLNNIKKKKENNISSSEKESANLSFDEFWQLYPKKEGKAKAHDKYNAHIKGGVLHADIMNGLAMYLRQIKQNNTEQQYIKHPTTWLNGKHWNDEYTSNPVNKKCKIEGLI